MDVRRFLSHTQSQRGWRDQIAFIEEIEAKKPRFAEPAAPLPEQITDALNRQKIEQLYLHQAQAVNLSREGRDFVVVTGTASGKTLCYNIPIFEKLLNEPNATALYLFPTKALAQDQVRGALRFLSQTSGIAATAGTYDGDTSPEARRNLRDSGQLIFTNPDMLHAGILPNHARWARFFERLSYVVVDEVHTYRGVFGSQVAGVLRRLDRITKHYGSRPQYLTSSATIANPVELASSLTGRDMALIDDDGSPRGAKSFALWNPPFIDEGEKVERLSPLTEAQRIMCDLIEDDIQTIAFVRTRKMVELLFRFTQDELSHRSASRASRIKPYRGGYLPEERRNIENQLFNGELLGVVSTNALELGIDIGSLEACLLVGYPGTIASTWQQAGRAGRGDAPSLVILVGQNTPVDQYLMHHGEYLFGKTPEHAIIDPNNPHIGIGHLRCAAHELPITKDESSDMFGEFTPALLDLLVDERHLKRIKEKWHWAQSSYPAAQVALRNIDDVTYTIQVEGENGPQILGTLDEMGAFMQAHTHAVYLHEGETYFVDKLDHEQKIAFVRREGLDYHTTAINEQYIHIDETTREDKWRVSNIYFGDTTVSVTVTMFKKIKFGSRDSIGYENLELPTRQMETTALWIVPSEKSLDLCRRWGKVPADGLKGIVNVLTEVVPMYVMGDVNDIGGVIDSSNLGRPAMFIYDKYPGGIGYSERAYDWTEQIMSTALDVINECLCKRGCPSCVGATMPETGLNGLDDREIVPDKDTALVLLHDMLEREPYTPKQLPLDSAPVPVKLAEPEPEMKPLPANIEEKIRSRVRNLRGGKK
jgi:DEAD/DEAH box helicase domain-containing protein